MAKLTSTWWGEHFLEALQAATDRGRLERGRSSEPKLAMGAEAHKLQHRVVRLPIDQHHVRFEMAVPVIAPVAGQRMVPIPLRQRLIGGERDQHLAKVGLQGGPVSPLDSRL